jgi:hypothetical protein
MAKRGSSQFLLLFLRPAVRLGSRIGGALALIALTAYAGAGLAPVLHQSAWKRALASDPLPKTWPWETSSPLAPTDVARLGLSAAVNEGAPEVEIAPSESSRSQNAQATRRQLGDVAVGDRITVTSADGSSQDYRVTGRKVLDPHLAEGDSVGPTGGKLSPVTCWPLDAVAGSLRLIIEATGVDRPKAPRPSVEQKL